MKKLFITYLPLFVLISCTPSTTISETDTNEAKNEINHVMNKWHESAAKANHDAYIGTMSTEGVYIGTDATENWTTLEFKEWSKPYFDKGQTWDFKTLERNIYISDDGKTAWFDELLDTSLGLCRGSGVFRLQQEEWKLRHYVLSITVPNDNLNEIIKINHATDSILIHQIKEKNR
ncbi:nuclear transport factor 2 family protein [Fulvivirgaceae bacterium BMA10]|uniref:Nuclear transport factor 2 family protein n=1 Tax=Splendidivirga corallicola TaxID=3051826 RepID=A0ABT8KX20_9BACT|nr:nuclear transport factor 2 family protein [Fulvivirgaceae bacterium BMA10]